jgi:hypothetical protein
MPKTQTPSPGYFDNIEHEPLKATLHTDHWLRVGALFIKKGRKEMGKEKEKEKREFTCIA